MQNSCFISPREMVGSNIFRKVVIYNHANFKYLATLKITTNETIILLWCNSASVWQQGDDGFDSWLNRVIAKDVKCSIYCCYVMINKISWPKTVAAHYNAQLFLLDKGCAMKVLNYVGWQEIQIQNVRKNDNYK